MSTQAAALPDESDPDGSAAWERALLDRQLEALGRLAEMGMAIAGAIERRVTEAPADESAGALHHAAMDFARVSRAVRLTFALQSRLIADFKAPPRARPANDDGDGDEDDDGSVELVWLPYPAGPREVKKDELKDALRERLETEGRDREDVERLVVRAGERLDTDDDLVLFGRPFADVLAQLCGDLGLEAPPPQGEPTLDALSAARAPPSG